MKFSSTPVEGVIVFSSMKGSSRFSDGQSAVACGFLSLDPLQNAGWSMDRSLQWHHDMYNLYILTARVTKSSRSSCASTNNLVFVPILYCNSICHSLITNCSIILFFKMKKHTLLVPREGVTDLPYTHWHVHVPWKHAVIVGEVWEWAIEMSRHLFQQPSFNFLVGNWNWDQLLLPQCQCDVSVTVILLLQWQQNISQQETDTNKNSEWSVSQWVKIIEITVHRSTGLKLNMCGA